jgi:hypothetical protein
MVRVLLGVVAAALWASVMPATAAAQTATSAGAGSQEAKVDAKVDAKFNGQVDTLLTGAAYSIRSDGAPQDISGQSGIGEVVMTYYLAPLLDDGAPLSLAPFLQRTSQVFADVGLRHFVTHNPNPGSIDRTEWHGWVAEGVDAYVTRMLVLNASFQYAYNALRDVDIDQRTHEFTGVAGVGLRAGDIQLDAAYAFTALRSAGSFSAPRWGSVQISAFAVIERRLAVRLTGTVLSGGVEGSAYLAYYPRRSFGIFTEGSMARAKLYLGDVIDKRSAGELGVSWWVSPSLRFVGQYTLTSDDVLGLYSELTHSVQLEASVRFD